MGKGVRLYITARKISIIGMYEPQRHRGHTREERKFLKQDGGLGAGYWY